VYESVVQYPESAVDIVYSKIKLDIDKWNNAVKWLGDSKSTPFHYLGYYPNSAELRRLSQLIQTYTETLKP
jgi:hypothetical protein